MKNNRTGYWEFCQGQKYTPVIPAIEKLGQEDHVLDSIWLHSKTMSQKQTEATNKRERKERFRDKIDLLSYS